MGVGAGYYMYNVVVEQFVFAITSCSYDEFLVIARRLYCLLIHKFTYLLQVQDATSGCLTDQHI